MHRRLSLWLVFALLFAALHLATHDLAAGDAGQSACQVCHLNHAPGAQLPPPSLALFALTLVFLLSRCPLPAAPARPLQRRLARAPPQL